MKSAIDLDFLMGLLYWGKDDLENVKSLGTTIWEREKKSLQTYTPVRAYLTERAVAFGGYLLEKSNSGSLILFLGQVTKKAVRCTAVNKVLPS